MHLRSRRGLRQEIASACMLVGFIGMTGCASEDELGLNETAIAGRVVDPAGVGISGVGIGVEFAVGPIPAAAPGSRGPLAPSADAVVLGPPYPNPATGAIAGGDVRIPLAVPAETTFTVSIYAPSGGVYEFVRQLPATHATRDTTLLWDGRGFGGYLPNGLYLVRLSVPEDPPAGTEPVVTEAAVLINRPSGLMEATAMNAESDIAGDYLVGDIPVGARILATNAQGNSLGTQRVSESIVLVLRSPDYLPEDVPLVIAPGDFLSLTTTLTPIFPVAAGPPAGAR